MGNQLVEASKSVDLPEVQDMIRRLGDYGLGVFLPHMHGESGGFEVLPSGVVQMESDLTVSFVPEDDPILDNATIVGWVWDKTKSRVASACACRGNHFPGGCSSPD